MKITSRLGVLLAKIAGKEASLEHMVPPWATNSEEELMLEIADRVDELESSSVPEVEDADKGKYLHSNETTGELEWAEAGGGGSGGLPTPTASDLGAGLCVVKTPVEGAVIVPEQTVEYDEEVGDYVLTNTNPTLFTEGAIVMVTVGENNGVLTIVDDDSITARFSDEVAGIYWNTSINMLCAWDDSADGEPITVKCSLANYTYEWGVDPYASWDFVAKVDWSNYSGIVVKGDYATVRAKLEAHTPCAFLVFCYGDGSSITDGAVCTVGYELEESDIFISLLLPNSSTSGWAWASDGTFVTTD